MSNRIITISREFGSGGRTVGRETAARLGLPCYDAELIEKLEEETGLSRKYIAERGEYASHGSWLASAFSDRDRSGHSVQDDLWCVQRRVILELAEKGPCVIVGRCADYILRDAAEKRLRDKDKRRAAYYYFRTERQEVIDAMFCGCRRLRRPAKRLLSNV